MKGDLGAAAPPSKPLMIFDGDYNFCVLWMRRWRQVAGDRVEYIPFQDPGVAAQFPELSRERCETAVHLLKAGGAVYSGAEAVFRALSYVPCRQHLLRRYQRTPAFAKFGEHSYRFVAEYRPLFSRLTRLRDR
jgi:predicted DCC family thiol-disulfide oxidoreductase YuxK